MDKEQIKQENIERFYLKEWGEEYFKVCDKGNLCLKPEGPEGPTIDFMEVIEDIKKENVQFPVVVRFHDIIRSQVKRLHTAFDEMIKESGYTGKYLGVYPIKVNKLRAVVDL